MSYLDIVKLALKERNVRQAAIAWGMEPMTLGRYANGERLPDYLTAKKFAEEAGISTGEMLEILADEEMKRKKKKDKLSASFDWLLRIANVALVRVPATA